jgi:hypothetical protein
MTPTFLILEVHFILAAFLYLIILTWTIGLGKVGRAVGVVVMAVSLLSVLQLKLSIQSLTLNETWDLQFPTPMWLKT